MVIYYRRELNCLNQQTSVVSTIDLLSEIVLRNCLNSIKNTSPWAILNMMVMAYSNFSKISSLTIPRVHKTTKTRTICHLSFVIENNFCEIHYRYLQKELLTVILYIHFPVSFTTWTDSRDRVIKTAHHTIEHCQWSL